MGSRWTAPPLSGELLAQCDVVIITSDHSCINYDWLVDKARHVLDTRNATSKVTTNREKITLL